MQLSYENESRWSINLKNIVRQTERNLVGVRLNKKYKAADSFKDVNNFAYRTRTPDVVCDTALDVRMLIPV
jgi:hypothetical protein